MKRIFLAGMVVLTFAFTSCETTKEITINADGTGNYSSTLDLSALVGLAKMSGGEGLEELGGRKIDSTMPLKSITDSISSLTTDERDLAGKGTFNALVDVDNDVMKTKISIPFSSVQELAKVDKIGSKAGTSAIMEAMGRGGSPDEMGELGTLKSSIDDYYNISFTANSISKKLDGEKYKALDDDEGMKAIQEMAGEGMSSSTTYVIRLPRPAKKAEGKYLTLSDDKKTVTIKESAEDFFDDGKSLEFTIEY